MLHFENCRTLSKKYDYYQKKFVPSDIVINSSIVNIDYAFNAFYWVNRLNETLFATATDRDGKQYNIYRNIEKNLMTAIPVKNNERK